MDSSEIAYSVLEPRFDAVRDEFARFEPESGEPLARMRRVRLIVDDRAHDTGRHFAATRTDGLLVLVSPELADLPPETAVAILAHECGHVADFLYPGCWTWPKAGAGGPSAWVGDGDRERARAWRTIFGKAGAQSRTSRDDAAPAQNWLSAWHRRTDDQVEWAADGIAEAVTGLRIGYSGPCLLQAFERGVARPAGLR